MIFMFRIQEGYSFPNPSSLFFSSNWRVRTSLQRIEKLNSDIMSSESNNFLLDPLLEDDVEMLSGEFEGETDPSISETEELQHTSSSILLSVEVARSRELSPPKRKLSRWRQVNINDRKGEKNKRRRNLGMAYIGSKGRDKSPRSMGPTCSCKLACRQALLGREEEIFNAFWDMGNYDKQNLYLFSRIQFDEPKQRKPLHSVNKHFRRNNFLFQYGVQLAGHRIKVCKKEFLAVHGLQNSKKRVDLICSQLKTGLLVPKPDGRGKHKSHRKYRDATLNYVREHINAVPKYTSHYSRNSNPNKVYFDCDMSISQLYRKYRKWLLEKKNSIYSLIPNDELLKDMIAVTHDKYRRIFCTEFNIGFKLPRSDTCKDCDKFKIDLDCNKDDLEATALIVQRRELHHKMAEEMQDDLKKTAESAKLFKNVDVIAFDLQQTLPTPCLTVGLAFYKRKAWTYNFGIHDCVANKGHMYLWSENIAKRGSEEMMSCMFKHFTNHKPSSPHLIAYSDNCGGQNKNWNFMALWMMLVNEEVYKSIEHRFLLPGHTRLPCDRDFGLIENRKKMVLQVYTPDGWAQVIKDANQKNPFSVTMMKRDDFFCFEGLTDYIDKKTKTDEKEPVKFMKARCFKFTFEDQNIIKHALNEEYKSITVCKPGHDSNTFCSDQIFPKYEANIPLAANKISDLRELLTYIPTKDWPFFNDIFAGGETGDPLEVEHL